MEIAEIMSFLLNLMGIAPTPTADGAFSPSKLATAGMTFANVITGFEGGVYKNPYNGSLRILMVCTQGPDSIQSLKVYLIQSRKTLQKLQEKIENGSM